MEICFFLLHLKVQKVLELIRSVLQVMGITVITSVSTCVILKRAIIIITLFKNIFIKIRVWNHLGLRSTCLNDNQGIEGKYEYTGAPASVRMPAPSRRRAVAPPLPPPLSPLPLPPLLPRP
ncbi:hypothetical protein G5I_11126 [Acromyrmex echinatior]|uniref:Uncharacterized protein n=1 Tax=Acromyrmex echinatior TaxID=103372 RepID=F4WYR2_ACREC|nr:hypothetical protein G5I_11126 [Acromyrmex echinatior]